MPFDRSFESPWPQTIKCTNCDCRPTRLHITYLHEWKKTYLCPQCLKKFNDYVDNIPGISDWNRTKYINEYKVIFQKVQ